MTDLDLAARLVEAWATDRGTQPEPAERDLTRWILELLGGPWHTDTLFQVALRAAQNQNQGVSDVPD